MIQTRVSLDTDVAFINQFLGYVNSSLPDLNRVAVILCSKQILEEQNLIEAKTNLLYESLTVRGKYQLYQVVCPDGDIDSSLRSIPLGERKIQLLIIAAHQVGGICFERGLLTPERVSLLGLEQLHRDATIVLDCCKGFYELAPAFQRKLPDAHILSSKMDQKGGVYVCSPPPELSVYCAFYGEGSKDVLDLRIPTLKTGIESVDKRIDEMFATIFLTYCRSGRPPKICELFKESAPKAVAFLLVNYIKKNPDQALDDLKPLFDDVIYLLKRESDCLHPFISVLTELAAGGNLLAEAFLYFANPDTTEIREENPLKYIAYGARQYRCFENLETALECFSRSSYEYSRPYLFELSEKREHPRAYFLRFLEEKWVYYLQKAVTLGYLEAIDYQREKGIVFTS